MFTKEEIASLAAILVGAGGKLVPVDYETRFRAVLRFGYDGKRIEFEEKPRPGGSDHGWHKTKGEALRSIRQSAVNAVEHCKEALADAETELAELDEKIKEYGGVDETTKPEV